MKTLQTTKQQIIAALDTLSEQDQARVLSLIHALTRKPEGITGQELLDFFSGFSFTQEEADEITRIYQELD